MDVVLRSSNYSLYHVPYYTILILCYTMLCYTMPYYTILYYAILYYTILYYAILHYAILYYSKGAKGAIAAVYGGRRLC